VLRRSVQIALIVAIATLQCVSSADVDDAYQRSRDGRSIVASAGAHGGVGAARDRATASILLGGVISRAFVLVPPVPSLIKLATVVTVRGSDTRFETPLAPRPPPALG
jgi:hypothetical protein